MFVLLGGSVFLSLGGGLGGRGIGALNFCTKETGEEPELSLASTGLLFFFNERFDIYPSD